jgi:hypothetical protein
LKLWLNKYDKDIGERTKELEDLQNSLARKEFEFNKWKTEVFDPQEQKFYDLMEEKRMEEESNSILTLA